MSETLTLKPSAVQNERVAESAPRLKFGAMFKAAIESLVAAQTRRFEDTQPLLYRFPPL